MLTIRLQGRRANWIRRNRDIADTGISHRFVLLLSVQRATNPRLLKKICPMARVIASVDLRADRGYLRADRGYLRADRVDLRADRVYLRADRVDLRADRGYLRADRVDLRADRVDLRADRVDLRADRVDLRADRVDLRADRGYLALPRIVDCLGAMMRKHKYVCVTSDREYARRIETPYLVVWLVPIVAVPVGCDRNTGIRKRFGDRIGCNTSNG